MVTGTGLEVVHARLHCPLRDLQIVAHELTGSLLAVEVSHVGGEVLPRGRAGVLGRDGLEVNRDGADDLGRHPRQERHEPQGSARPGFNGVGADDAGAVPPLLRLPERVRIRHNGVVPQRLFGQEAVHRVRDVTCLIDRPGGHLHVPEHSRSFACRQRGLRAQTCDRQAAVHRLDLVVEQDFPTDCPIAAPHRRRAELGIFGPAPHDEVPLTVGGVHAGDDLLVGDLQLAERLGRLIGRVAENLMVEVVRNPGLVLG